MTDQTPEELDALLDRLQKLGRDMDRHAHPDWDEHEDVFAAVNAITALRDREAMIEAAAIERAAEIPLQWLRNYPAAETRKSINLSILALAKPGARAMLDQRIAEAEQAGYERGLRETINSIAINDHVSNDRLAQLLPQLTRFFRGAASDEQIAEHYAICKEAAALRGISI